MAWPLTGSVLTKYNRLLSDLRQYGDFIFVGAPDDITWLQETIVAASDGVLHPSLDDVANRSHYWMLELSRVLGEKVVEPTPCPECPECPPVVPCPPCPPLEGIDWGPDNTVLEDFFVNAGGLGASASITSLTFHSLESVTGTFDISSANLVEVFVPKLATVGTELDIGGPAVQTLDFPELVSVTGSIYATNSPAPGVSFPKLASVGGDCDIVDNLDAITEADFPELVSVGAILAGLSCNILTRVGYPKLVTVGGDLLHNLNPLLSEVSFPVFLPTNGTDLNFADNALDASSVNHILARAVANAAYISGTIDTSGGTSSAPTGQGIADKATLIGRGVTVTTN